MLKTKEEVIKALKTVRDFCNQQDEESCLQCPFNWREVNEYGTFERCKINEVLDIDTNLPCDWCIEELEDDN